MHENRLFGRYLRDYREKGVISSRIRTTSVMTLWAFMGLSAFLLWERLWIVALLVLIGSAVTVHLFSLPTASATASAD